MPLIQKKLRDKLAYLFGDASLPQRLNTARALLAGRSGREDPVQPWMLQVEVTNRCNMDCIFCSRHEHELHLGDLSPELFDAVVALSEKAQETALFGYGEPLMSKAFYELLPRLRSARIGFFTNGMILDRKCFERILHLSNRPISYIVYSIDGGTAATYERIRRKASFDRVWKNLSEVSALRKELGAKLSLRIEFVAMRSNVEELPALLSMAEKAGVDVVKVSHLVVWDESLRDESLFYHQDLCRKAFEVAAKAVETKKVSLDLPKVFGLKTVPAPPCRMPWNYAMVTYESELRACCFAPEAMTMGSLVETPFKDIWLSPRYRALRRSLASGNGPKVCATCEERFRYHPSENEEATYIKLQPRKK